MKRINKKGFTLIELLAVIIILGVLLLVAVPSVSRYIQSSRMDTYETNLSKLVDAVSTEVNSYSSSNYSFKSNEYLIVPLTCIEVERGSNSESPFGAYEPENSYVVVTRKYETDANGTTTPIGFDYYVTARDVNGFGATLALASEVEVSDQPTVTSITKSDTTDGSGNTVTTYSVTLPSTVTNITGKQPKLYACDAWKTAMSSVVASN